MLSLEKAFMSTDSSSTQLCPQQLDDVLGPDLTRFEIFICQLISKDEDQIYRSKALFDLALRSRPDSLLLALSELLSPFSLVRVEAAKQIGEILTTFSSNFRKTTLDTLKLDLLSADRNEMLDSDVRKHLLRTISDFHATGSWPELLPYLFKWVDSQSHYLQENALLVFKSLAENSNGNAALIPYLKTFQKIFSECLGNCSSWDVKIAALDASISFVQFIPNREDPNRFDYLLRLMMLTLTEALNSGLESKTEDSLHLLIKLAGTDPRFFERQLEKVLRLMLKITVDDSLEVNIKHLVIQFLMALVEKEPRMISKESQFIKRLFDELMYMLFDVEEVDDAAGVAVRVAAGVAVDTVFAVAAANDATTVDSNGDEVDNFWKLNNYTLGKECLSKLSISLGEKTIFQWVLRLFSHLLGTSRWQQGHAVLIAIPIIAKGCYKVMLENLDEIVPEVLKSLNDLHPCVQLAAIKAIKRLSLVWSYKHDMMQ